LADAGRLEVLHDTETIINTYLQILHNANGRWDYFADARSLSLIPSFEVIKKAILEAKARDVHFPGFADSKDSSSLVVKIA